MRLQYISALGIFLNLASAGQVENNYALQSLGNTQRPESPLTPVDSAARGRKRPGGPLYRADRRRPASSLTPVNPPGRGLKRPGGPLYRADRRGPANSLPPVSAEKQLVGCHLLLFLNRIVVADQFSFAPGQGTLYWDGYAIKYRVNEQCDRQDDDWTDGTWPSHEPNLSIQADLVYADEDFEWDLWAKRDLRCFDD